MRELTVRVRFTRPALGNVAGPQGRMLLPRGVDGRLIFLNSWHAANMRFAAKLLGRHQREVDNIHWDQEVDCALPAGCWHRRYYRSPGGKSRYVVHEAMLPGQVAGFNCVVPAGIPDDDLWQLMELAGRYRGLSPYEPKEYGLFKVESIRARRELPRGEGVPNVQADGRGGEAVPARLKEARAGLAPLPRPDGSTEG